MEPQGFLGADLPLLADDEGCIVVRTLEDDGTEREQSWRGATGQETMAGLEVRYGAAVVARFPPEMVVTWQQVPWTMTRKICCRRSFSRRTESSRVSGATRRSAHGYTGSR